MTLDGTVNKPDLVGTSLNRCNVFVLDCSTKPSRLTDYDRCWDWWVCYGTGHNVLQTNNPQILMSKNAILEGLFIGPSLI